MSAIAMAPRKRFPVLLVGSDGSNEMPAAITLAHLIALREPSDVHVVTALEPLPAVTPEINLPLTPEIEEARRVALGKRVLEQLAEFAPDAAQWTVRLVDGHPDATIVQAAREVHASLIILGLGEHGIVDRWFGGETALRVLRLSEAPVLAVAPLARTLPSRVLVATDFSETSERALHDALSLLAPDATVTLVHVIANDISMGVWPTWDEEYEHAVTASLTELQARVTAAGLHVTENLILTGEPARAILQQADKMQADLIVTGTHGHNFVAGAFLGRVSTKIIRGARCSVFVHPPVRRAT